MESYEVEIKGQTHKVKCVNNLCGHPKIFNGQKGYLFHFGIVKNNDNTKMEEVSLLTIKYFRVRFML
jgi:methionyl aminopeptidase